MKERPKKKIKQQKKFNIQYLFFDVLVVQLIFQFLMLDDTLNFFRLNKTIYSLTNKIMMKKFNDLINSFSFENDI